MLRFKSILLNASFFLNILLIFFLVFEEKLANLPVSLQVLGRMHPMVLHFPVVLIILLLLFHLILPRKEATDTSTLIPFLLAFNALTASFTALAGLLLFHTGDYAGGETLQWHKWTGIGVALIAWIFPWIWTHQRRFYLPSLILTVIVTLIAGHNGATITHGDGFLTQPLGQLRNKETDLQNAMIFSDIIQPVLNEKCTGCHNPNKSKGDLILISEAFLLKGGESGSVLVPGNPDSSLLYQLLLLPMNDDRHMPPEGKPQLEEEERRLLHWWISTGAPFQVKYAENQVPDSIATIVKAKYGPGSPLDKLDIGFADPALIASLNSPTRTVRQISGSRPYIEVYMGSKKDFRKEDLSGLKKLAQQIVSIDLAGAAVRDEHLAELKHFPHLQKLYLDNTGVSDEGVKTLASLNYLEYLNLSNTAVTTSVLTTLTAAESLKKAYFYGVDIPITDLQQFANAKKLEQFGYTPDLSDSVYSAKLTTPTVTVDSLLFTEFATIEMNYRLRGVNIHYTTNGLDPVESDPIYTQPLRIDSTCRLKTRAIKKGWESSPVTEHTLLRSRYSFTGARLNPQPSASYPGRLDTTLIDFQRGSLSHGDGKYVGYEGQNIYITLDLGKSVPVSGIAVGYILNHGAYILSPGRIDVSGSVQPGNQQLLRRIAIGDTAFTGGAHQRSALLTIPRQNLRYITLNVQNPGILPAWHPGKGSKSWVFLDEVVAF